MGEESVVRISEVLSHFICFGVQFASMGILFSFHND
uniref:Uncharacterized protein n=1 Tax=Anguilla anguilla TaxID=7936 RepID=A0A0E9XMV3_ANGAN